MEQKGEIQIIEKGKISSFQMAMMMNPTITATAILLVPAISGKHAKQDMWVSPVWASIIGFLAVLIAVQLNKLYPQKTIIQYSEDILGRVIGKIVGLIFLLFYLHADGIVLREYGDFVVGNFLMKTPMVVVIGGMTFLCAMAVRGGIEVLARATQLFLPVVLFLYLVIIILLFPDMELKHMFPAFSKGIQPSLMGAVTPGSWFSEFVLIAFLLPYLTDREKGLKMGMLSVFSVLVVLVITNFSGLLLFGNITADLTYRTMSAARYISIADFFEHLEAIIMAVWVLGVFIKTSVFYYAIVIGTAQWLDLSDYRPIVFPIALLLVILSIWSSANLQEMTHFLGTSWPFYACSIQILIPMILLPVAMLRKKGEQKP